MFKALISLIILATFLTGNQESFTLSFQPEFIVTGTSNLKSWEISSNQAEGKATIKVEDNKVVRIDALEVTIPVHSLKSDNSQMDRNIQKALKANEFPEISFLFTKMLSSEKKGNKQIIKAAGNLTIAGVTQKVVLQVESEATKGKVSFEGKTALRMTSFNIEPPTAIMGTLKTGDIITVKFNVQFQPNNKI